MKKLWLFIVSSLLTIGAQAGVILSNATVNCTDVFPHAINSHSGGTLNMYGSYHLTNDPDDQALPFTNSGSLAANSCGDNRRCAISGVSAEEGDVPNFREPSCISQCDSLIINGTTESIGYREMSWAMDTQWKSINISGGGVANFALTDLGFGYRVNQVQINDGTVNLVSGDYYFGSLNIYNDSVINIDTSSGSGMVRLHINSTLQLDNGSINLNGDPDDLAIYVHSDLNVYNDTPVNAMIYAEGNAFLNNTSQITGRVSASNITMNSQANVTFAGELDNDGLSSFCAISPPVGECPASSQIGDVIINEVNVTNSGNPKVYWLELYVKSGSNISLSGWQILGEGNGNDNIAYTCSGACASQTYSAGDYIVVTSEISDNIQDAIDDGVLTLNSNLFIDSSLEIHQNIQEILLVDDNGDMVHYLQYSTSNNPDFEYQDCADENGDNTTITDPPGNNNNICSQPDGSLDGENNWENADCGDTPGESNEGSEVDHYEIILSTLETSVCIEPTVTVQACENASCDLYSEETQATLFKSIDGATPEVVNSAAFTGSKSSSIEQLTLANVSFSLGSQNPDASVICKDSAGTSLDTCAISFTSDPRFDLEMADSESCLDKAITVRVWEYNENMECQEVYGDTDINVSFSYQTPNAGFNSLTVTGSSQETISSIQTTTQTVSLGTANNLTLNYSDAGRLSIDISDPAGDILSGDGNTVFYPKDIVVTHSNASFVAERDFNFQVVGRCENGNSTPNYQPNSLSFTALRTEPNSGGVNGIFEYASGHSISVTTEENTTSATSSQASYSAASYSEWGSFTLKASESNYFTNSIPAAITATTFGRFIADDIVFSSVENGSFASHGSPNSFNYLAESFGYLEPPEFTLHAEGASDGQLQNYPSPVDPVVTFTSDVGHPELSTPDGVVIDPSTTAGIYTYQMPIDNTYTYAKNVTPFAPFTSVITINIEANTYTDSDFVQNSEAFVITPDQVELRDGRFYPQQASGPTGGEIEPVFAMQYFNGTSWVINEDDDSDFLAAYFTTDPASNSGDYNSGFNVSLNDGRDGVTSTVTVTWAGTPTGGTFSFSLDESGADNGTVNFIWNNNMPVWMQADWGLNSTEVTPPPATPVTFGRFQANDRIISWREID